LVVSLGATGYSDRILSAVVGEEMRGLRTSLAQTIRDPAELERTLEVRRDELERSYGLDQPWYARTPAMVLRVLTLELGEARTVRSTDGSNSIVDIVLERLPNTMLLLTTSLLITAAIGVSVGVWLSTRVGSRIDRFVSWASAVSYALPGWWTGILLILILGFGLRLLPSGGMFSTPPPTDPLARFLDLLYHAILPILTLVVVSVGPSIYVVRTMTLTVAQDDHVTLARAKGLPERMVLRRHVLRVAAPPVVTGLILGLAGTPDEGLIVALTFMFTLLYVIARLILEILYVFLDPRVRYDDARPAAA
jgi:peptide/nickel transport system permease protein